RHRGDGPRDLRAHPARLARGRADRHVPACATSDADRSHRRAEGRVMETLVQDVRYALRQLRSHPGFTVAVVLTLALGIGANTAVFSVLNGVLLKPLSYAKPDRLAVVWERNVKHGTDFNVVNPRNYLDWRDQATSFSELPAPG